MGETFMACDTCGCNCCKWLKEQGRRDYSDMTEFDFYNLMPVDVLIDYQIHTGKKFDKLMWNFELSELGRKDLNSILEGVPIGERLTKCIAYLGGYQFGIFAGCDKNA